MRCNAKLTRPPGQRHAKVVCTSPFCQGTEAQCQLCKTIYSLSEATCPNCREKGSVQKRNLNTVDCGVCKCPCFRSDVIVPVLPNRKPCGHGMCQSCVAEIVLMAVTEKTLVSLFKCPNHQCKAQYDVSQFQTALVAMKDPETTKKMNEFHSLQGLFTFISTQPPGEVLL